MKLALLINFISANFLIKIMRYLIILFTLITFQLSAQIEVDKENCSTATKAELDAITPTPSDPCTTRYVEEEAHKGTWQYNGTNWEITATDDPDPVQNIFTDGTPGNIRIADGNELILNVSDADSVSTNELQTISRTANDITLSDGGGTVSIEDNDNDPTNEIQDLSGYQLSSADGDTDSTNEIQDLTPYQTKAEDGDISDTNELQTLSQSGDDITLSNGGGTVTVSGGGNPTDEIQDISTDNTSGNISISDGSTITLNVDDNDSSTSNELQTISISGNDITLSDNGGTISVPSSADNSITNEIQDISTDDTPGNITISNGSTITLNVNDPDASTLNEIQLLTSNDNSVSLTQSGFNYDLSVAANGDNSSTNEIQDIFKRVRADDNGVAVADNDNDVLDIEGGTGISTSQTSDRITITNNLPDQVVNITGSTGTYPNFTVTDNDTQLTEAQVDAFADNNGYLESEVDGSTTNEIQSITSTDNSVALTQTGNDYDLSVDFTASGDNSSTNEIQDFTQSGNTIGLTLSNSTFDLTDYVNIWTKDANNNISYDLGNLSVTKSLPVLNLENTLGDGGSGSTIIFGHDQANDQTPLAEISSFLINGTSNRSGDLLFSTSASGALNERMRLLSNGNLGIGEILPLSKVHIGTEDLGFIEDDEVNLFRMDNTSGNPRSIRFTSRRHTDGSTWFGTNDRLQKFVGETPMGFIDFGIDNENASFGLGIGAESETYITINPNGGYVSIDTTLRIYTPEIQLNPTKLLVYNESTTDVQIVEVDDIKLSDTDISSLGYIKTTPWKEVSDAVEYEDSAPIARLYNDDKTLVNGQFCGGLEFYTDDNSNAGSNASIKSFGRGNAGLLSMHFYAGADSEIMRFDGASLDALIFSNLTVSDDLFVDDINADNIDLTADAIIAGNVAIGKTAAETLLDVDGQSTGRVSYTLGTFDSSHRGIVVDNDANTSWNIWEGKNNANGVVGRLSGAGLIYIKDKVGIGTETPDANLEIEDISPVIRLTGTDQTISSNQVVGSIEFYQSDLGGAGVGASITAAGDGSQGDLDLRFNVGDNSEAMEIDGISGFIGVGTSAINNVPLIIAGGSSAGASSGGYIQNGLSNTINLGISDIGIQARTNLQASLLLINDQGGDIETNRLGGNVGIGIQSPSSKLEVDGAITFGYGTNTDNGTMRFSTNEGFEIRSEGEWKTILKQSLNATPVSYTTSVPLADTDHIDDCILIPDELDDWYIKEVTYSFLQPAATSFNFWLESINGATSQSLNTIPSNGTRRSDSFSSGQIQVSWGQCYYVRTASISGTAQPKGVAFSIVLEPNAN